MMDSNWALVILTMVLIALTGFYAWQTRRLAADTKRMADVMFKDYEIRVRPILVIWLGRSGLIVELSVKSHSLYPVQMTKVRFHFRFQGTEYSDEKDYKLPPELDKVIRPDDNRIFPISIDWEGVRTVIPGLSESPPISQVELDCSLFFLDAEGKEIKIRRGSWKRL